jgi:hypothetical protein
LPFAYSSAVVAAYVGSYFHPAVMIVGFPVLLAMIAGLCVYLAPGYGSGDVRTLRWARGPPPTSRCGACTHPTCSKACRRSSPGPNDAVFYDALLLLTDANTPLETSARRDVLRQINALIESRYDLDRHRAQIGSLLNDAALSALESELRDLERRQSEAVRTGRCSGRRIAWRGRRIVRRPFGKRARPARFVRPSGRAGRGDPPGARGHPLFAARLRLPRPRFPRRTWPTSAKPWRASRTRRGPSNRPPTKCARCVRRKRSRQPETKARRGRRFAPFLPPEQNGMTDKKKIVVLGSGPIRIGQGIEFDYASVHCVWALREAGYEAIIINNNPETVSTDFDTSDRLYFEPLTSEDVLNVIDREAPRGRAYRPFGGQTAINLARPGRRGVPILGRRESIDLAEDRTVRGAAAQLGHPKPAGRAYERERPSKWRARSSIVPGSALITSWAAAIGDVAKRRRTARLHALRLWPFRPRPRSW